MAYCIKCGNKAEDDAQFCGSCGAPAIPTPPAPQTPLTSPTGQTTVLSNDAMTPNGVPHGNYEALKGIVPPMSDAEANKGMAALAYILFFIPLLTGDHKKSPFVRFHTNQGAILFILSLAIGVATNIIMAVLRAFLLNVYTWGLYDIIRAMISVAWIVPLVLLVLGIMNASSGKKKPLPIIGDRFTIIK